jgi:lipopolysaccharide/colanic/teichoic acid biosynthesis glycosyltransferase
VQKRALDLIIAIPMALFLAPVIGMIAAMLWSQGAQVFYISDRMRRPNQTFRLIKFCTMKPVQTDHGPTGADKSERITKLGHLLRRSRLDETPQIWHVLRGEMSFVGPRPIDPAYVALCPELLLPILKMRPGVTGLATLKYHRHEAKLLSRSTCADQNWARYAHNCLPRKARLDLIYARHQSIGFDLWIMTATILGLWSAAFKQLSRFCRAALRQLAHDAAKTDPAKHRPS